MEPRATDDESEIAPGAAVWTASEMINPIDFPVLISKVSIKVNPVGGESSPMPNPCRLYPPRILAPSVLLLMRIELLALSMSLSRKVANWILAPV
jgi:hypothetical protein